MSLMPNRCSPYRTTGLKTATRDHGCISYVGTTIVEWDQDNVTLRSGGWQTVTTKRKMCQVSQQFGLGFLVYQHKGDWFVSLPCGGTMPFRDGMTFERASRYAA